MRLRSRRSLLIAFLFVFPGETSTLGVRFITVRTVRGFFLHVQPLSISVVLLHVLKLDGPVWNL